MKFVNGSDYWGHFQAACHTHSVLIGTVTASCDENLNINFVHSVLPLPEPKALHYPPLIGSYLVASR